jgi:hypothetical protein
MFVFKCLVCNGISYSASADTTGPCIYCRTKNSVEKIDEDGVKGEARGKRQEARGERPGV